MKRITLNRLFALAISLTMLVSLAACNGDSDGSSGITPGEESSPSEKNIVDPIYDAPVNTAPTSELLIYIPKFGLIANGINTALAVFKEAYPDVKVITETLGDDTGWGWQEYMNRVNNELMAGAGPDVIVVSPVFFLNPYKTMDSGAFLNISSLLDADEAFGQENYNETVLDAGQYKGGRYIIPLSYTLPILNTSQGVLDTIGFDVTKNTDSISLFNEIAVCLPKALENKAFIFMFSNGDIYSTLNETGMSLINWESKSILPDESAFRSFCEAYKPYWNASQNSVSLSNNDTFTALQKGEYIFAKDAFDSYSTFLLQSAYKTFDTPVMTAMYSANGELVSCVQDALAINANSKNQQNAYNFIKIMLSESIQKDMMNLSGFPVNKQAFAALAEEQINRDGGVWETSAMSPVCAPLGDDELNAYLALHESMTKCKLWDWSSMEFLTCMEAYFKDEKTLDECINELKSKLRLFVDE